jgi:hypothetical protein
VLGGSLAICGSEPFEGCAVSHTLAVVHAARAVQTIPPVNSVAVVVSSGGVDGVAGVMPGSSSSSSALQGTAAVLCKWLQE